MKRQMIISGIGGQGVLFVTRIIAQAAMNRSLNVLTAETHGMAQRGGTVISTIKLGDFASPLIRAGHADTGLFLHDMNLDIHRHFLQAEVIPFVNSQRQLDARVIDASGIARARKAPVLANLVLLGFCLQQGGLPFDLEEIETAITQTTKPSQLASNLEIFLEGFHHGASA